MDAKFTQILRFGDCDVAVMAVHHSGGSLIRGEVVHGRRIEAVVLVGVSVRLGDVREPREWSGGEHRGGLVHPRPGRSHCKSEVAVLSRIGRVVEVGIELGVPVVLSNLPHLLSVLHLLLLLLQSLLLLLQSQLISLQLFLLLLHMLQLLRLNELRTLWLNELRTLRFLGLHWPAPSSTFCRAASRSRPFPVQRSLGRPLSPRLGPPMFVEKGLHVRLGVTSLGGLGRPVPHRRHPLELFQHLEGALLYPPLELEPVAVLICAVGGVVGQDMVLFVVHLRAPTPVFRLGQRDDRRAAADHVGGVSVRVRAEVGDTGDAAEGPHGGLGVAELILVEADAAVFRHL